MKTNIFEKVVHCSLAIIINDPELHIFHHMVIIVRAVFPYLRRDEKGAGRLLSFDAVMGTYFILASTSSKMICALTWFRTLISSGCSTVFLTMLMTSSFRFIVERKFRWRCPSVAIAFGILHLSKNNRIPACPPAQLVFHLWLSLPFYRPFRLLINALRHVNQMALRDVFQLLQDLNGSSLKMRRCEGRLYVLATVLAIY